MRCCACWRATGTASTCSTSYRLWRGDCACAPGRPRRARARMRRRCGAWGCDPGCGRGGAGGGVRGPGARWPCRAQVRAVTARRRPGLPGPQQPALQPGKHDHGGGLGADGKPKPRQGDVAEQPRGPSQLRAAAIRTQGCEGQGSQREQRARPAQHGRTHTARYRPGRAASSPTAPVTSAAQRHRLAEPHPAPVAAPVPSRRPRTPPAPRSR